MCDDKRHKPQLHFRQLQEGKRRSADPAVELLDAVAEGHKQQQHRNAGDDLRIEDGQVGDVHNKGLEPFAAHGIDADRRHGAQHQCDHRGRQRNDKGIAQRGKDQLIVEQLPVPMEGKARPVGTGFGLIEAENDKNDDGQIQEDKYEAGIKLCVPFHISIPPLSSLSSNWFIRLMTSRIKTISTSEMAEPRLGL